MSFCAHPRDKSWRAKSWRLVSPGPLSARSLRSLGFRKSPRPSKKNPRSANGSVLAAVLAQQRQRQHQCYHATARKQGQCTVGLHSCSGRLILHRAGGTLRLTNEIDDSHHCVIAGRFSGSYYVISNTFASAHLSLAAARSDGARYVTHRVNYVYLSSGTSAGFWLGGVTRRRKF